LSIVSPSNAFSVGPQTGDRLRVGLLCHPGTGGSVRIAVELGLALHARGWEVHVFSRTAPLGMTPPPGIAFHTLKREPCDRVMTNLDLAWSVEDIEDFASCVVSVARNRSLHVLHFHYAVPFAEVLDKVARAMGERAPALIGTLHGTDVSDRVQGQVCAALTSALQRLDAITTVSQSHAALAAHVFGLDRPPRVIANFVDTDRFFPTSEDVVRPRRPRIIHVSNFRPIKQPESMARIYIKTRRRLDAALWLVGDGDGMGAVRQCLSSAGMSADVLHFGIRHDVENVVRDADVMLVSSRTESFCLAALEAAASGVPVIAPRVGGLSEVIAHRETGLLFEPENEDAAADALVELLSQPELRGRMRRNAVARARDLSARSIVPQYQQLYRDAVSKRVAGGLMSMAEFG